MAIDINELRRKVNSTDVVDRLEAAEKERARDEECIADLMADLNRVGHENDALRAKIERMEQQEPVATIHINSITGNPSVDFIPGHCYLHHNSSLYALPGVKGEEK